MPFLVRKLIKRDRIYELLKEEELGNITADIPTTEFRTKNGTLSTWRIESLDELENAVLAIVVSSSEISRMDFIVIDTKKLDEQGLLYDQTYAGLDIAIPDLQKSHYDIINISLDKLFDCTKLYQSIITDDSHKEVFVRRYAAGEIRDLLEKALVDDRIDKAKAKDKILKEINKIEGKLYSA